MASIYDIARIASGDPMERVSDRAKEADVLFNQYERQKEIVNEINDLKLHFSTLYEYIKRAEDTKKGGKKNASKSRKGTTVHN